MFLYLSKFKIHPLQIITLLLLLFWRSHCESPRAYVQSPARNREGDGSLYSLPTGGNPKQTHLPSVLLCLFLLWLCCHVATYLLASVLVYTEQISHFLRTQKRWGCSSFEAVSYSLFLFGLETTETEFCWPQDWFACARMNSTFRKKISKSKKMFRSEPLSICVCYWNIPKSEKQKKFLKNLFSSNL